MPTHSLTPSAVSRRSFLRRSAFAVAAAGAGSSLLTACGSDSSGASDGGKVTFLSLLPLETLALAPELLAVAGGHFRNHGLDVALEPVKGSPQAMQGLLAGTSPISRVGQIDVLTTAADANQPIVGIGTLTRGSSVRIVYSKTNHPLNTPRDFLGQTMGVPSEGGTSDKVVSLVLANSGLDPAQTKRQVVGLTPGTYNLIQQRRLVGYVVSIDTANIVVSQNADAGVFDPSTVVRSDSQVYVTTRDAMAKQPDTLKAFMAGIRDSLAAMVADESFDETLKQLRGTYSFATLEDDKIAKESLRQSRDLWTAGAQRKPLLITDPVAWTGGYDELVAAGLAKPGANAASWIDNSMLPAS